MNKTDRKAFGKINIGLQITGKREDGYHTLKTLFLPIHLWDDLRVSKGGTWSAPFGEGDLMSQGKVALEKSLGRSLDAGVDITKRIPVAAGLAGGTADGAAMVLALRELFQMPKSLDLLEVVGPLGADFPYMLFLENGNFAPVLGEGIGHILTPLEEVPEIPLVLLNPGYGISTPQAYRHYKKEEGEYQPLIAHQYLLHGDYQSLKDVVINDLAPYIRKSYPEIRRMEEDLYQAGALFAQMTGSGPTVYGMFSNFNKRDLAFDLLKDKYPTVIKTTGGGKNAFGDTPT